MLLTLLLYFTTVYALVIPSVVVQPQDVLQSHRSRPVDVSSLIDRNDFDSWIAVQPNISIDHILDNIGGPCSFNNDNDHLPPGVVVAATSIKDPNYNYQWIRDAAITIDTLITHLNDIGFANHSIARTIENYISNSYLVQRATNPSGGFNSGGLGEPKFNIDNTPFTADWGRPQNDGPALRSITIMNYLNLVKKYNNDTLLSISDGNVYYNSTKDIYTNIIKPDLTYIIQHWNTRGFDLWEEINGVHFFTSLSQFKALKKGLIMAKHFKDYKFMEKLNAITIRIQNFIWFDSGFIDKDFHRIYENPNFDHKYGLDIATIIASLSCHAYSNDLDDNLGFEIPFDVDDSYVLNSIYGFIKDQNRRYSVNHDEDKLGISLGRYPNDVYDGVGTSLGNPWFLSNAYASLFIYRKLFKLLHYEEDLVISNKNFEFYNDYIYDLSNISEDYTKFDFVVINYRSSEFNMMVNNLFSFGDSFLKVVFAHITEDGELSEQFNRDTGFSQGAQNLTWSYSSVWNALRERSIIDSLL
ncbi:glucan 1,4-alpha-glucosidase [Saccharomycopsis crataegensis]|uniref:glucan 1,4-alpha-glucosidase n=1 Tax=Saccharomycopsis crataegensis TaxID=43959 RepID=A0AAV5QJE7_9ASCO|nr:glucan 1,4-alpha-glucosidase [Saccharomycopsis crataegensis]